MAADPSRFQALVGGGIVLLLLAGAYVVLAPFLPSIAWAAILAYATWPVYRRLRRGLGERALWAALAMMGLVLLAIAVPIALLSVALADEVAAAYRTLRSWGEAPPALPDWLAELPLVGPWLATSRATLVESPGALQRLVVERAGGLTQAILSTAGDVGRNLGRLGATLLTLFFLYRHGETVLAQSDRVVTRLAGEAVRSRLALVGATVRGVCYGVLLTAVTQGVLAGLGFWLFGIGSAVLLGALTALLALLPFGPPLVWAPAGLWVLLTGGVWKGLALLAWGALLVSGIDNVLRPHFIGGAAQAPFLLVLFGVLGGLSAFGLLGLFLGPVILAVLVALWREWGRAGA